MESLFNPEIVTPLIPAAQIKFYLATLAVFENNFLHYCKTTPAFLTRLHILIHLSILMHDAGLFFTHCLQNSVSAFN